VNQNGENINMEEELEAEFKEDDTILQGNKGLDCTIKLNDLKKVGVLGQGASGYVEKCFHKPTKTRIALKMIPVDSNTTVKKALILELKTLHDCDSDYIVRSYGAFLKGGENLLNFNLVYYRILPYCT
jgi:serine/threonine protein kinase